VLESDEILVIDDEPDVRDGLAEALRSEGYAVRTAGNGEEALRELRGGLVGLILLDLMMPVMDGWQFRQAQKRDPRLASIPVVVVTASGADFRDADAVLRKPFDLADLVRVVRLIRERLGLAPGDRGDLAHGRLPADPDDSRGR
jgi:CheY-like chemotaxis protein